MTEVIVYTVGLNDNPETLIARARFVMGHHQETVLALDEMYHNVFNRLDVHGDRSPYPFHEVVQDLVELGFDMRDWTGANVRSILPFNPKDKQTVTLRFASRVTFAYATVKVPAPSAQAFVTDMEQSGLWLLAEVAGK